MNYKAERGMRGDKLTADSSSETLVEKEYTCHTEQSPIEVIIEAVAEAASVDPLKLPPIYDIVDPDAVNKLFSPRNATRAGQYFSFKFEEWIVSIHADGVIRVRDAIQPIEL